MKLRLPSLLRRLLTATAAVTAVTVGTHNSDAGVMTTQILQRTYADFGQNKGRYATTTNALLDYLRQQAGGIVLCDASGNVTYTISLDQGMISYANQTDNGAAALVGYNYLATVEHNGEIDATFGSRYLGWDNCVKYSAIEYRYSSSFRNVPAVDYKVTRLSKVVTDVTPAAVYTGDVVSLAGSLLYRAGAGTMYKTDTEGNQSWSASAYGFIIGGIDTIDSGYYSGSGDGSYTIYWDMKYTADDLLTTDPLATSLGAGDSGSPVYIYNTSTGQYEYISASQSGNIANANWSRGAGTYTENVIDEDTVQVLDTTAATLYINAVSTTAAGTVEDTDSDGNVTYSGTYWQGTVSNDSGTEVATFNGVQSGVNTWENLIGLKNTDNWYGYGEDYLNAAWSVTTDKDLDFADLFLTSNLQFNSWQTNTTIVLTDTVDLGVGYAQFSGSTNVYTIVSESGESNQFNHAGYVIDAGVTVHLQLVNPSDYMFEWRKTGAGDLYIDGSGDTNALLNVGGSGTTYLQQTGGYAAYNVLANNGATVVIADVSQIERDFTFGLGGAVLDMNGNSMDWYTTAETLDGSVDPDDTRFSINALTEEAIITNSSSDTVTLTYRESGETTYLGSFVDTAAGALSIVADAGSDSVWTLNSIRTDLTNNSASGLTVASGTVVLVGTNTEHGLGSADNASWGSQVYFSADDWHYADAAMNVTVQNGGTFELGSHARLTGDITVQDGGTFIMREGVKSQYEYIEGWYVLEDTYAISDYYGLKGNVVLNEGAAMKVQYNSGVTSNTTYAGSISGAGNMEVDLGSVDASLTLAGSNTFTGTKTLTSGYLIASSTAALGDTTTVSGNGWNIASGAVLTVRSGLTADNALSYIASFSTGTLALSEDMTDVMDMSNHTGLFIGAAQGYTVQYGSADDTLAAVDGKWNLGGGGGDLVVNAKLSNANGELVLGNGSNTGIVTLTNANNQIGSITFNPGVVLNFDSTAALGGASITLAYTSSLMGAGSTSDLLDLITSDASGAVLMDRFGESTVSETDSSGIDLSGHTSLAIGSYGNTTYAGTITVADGAAYRFGGAGGTLTLTGALTGAHNLIIDGQTHTGGVIKLGAVSSVTGTVSIMGWDSTQTTKTTGDMTLAFGVDNALSTATATTVYAGGILDVSGTTQTFTDLVVKDGGLLKGDSGSTLIFNMTKTGDENYFLYGSMRLGNVIKQGDGELVFAAADNEWELFTIQGGTTFTRVDNALSATGITRVENGGTLNMNTWDGDGFRSRTMQGNIVLGNGSILTTGDTSGTVAFSVTHNGTISVDAGATATVTGKNWYLTSALNNANGGTIDFSAQSLHLPSTVTQAIDGTVNIAADSVAFYSDGGADNMLKQFSHLNIDSGKSLSLDDASWNTIWQLDKLTGSGSLSYTSDTTHWYTSRLVIGGDGAFSGSISMTRSYAASDRVYQGWVEIAGDNAATGATVSLSGSAATSVASMAVNTADAHIGGLNGNAYTYLMSGAAPTDAKLTAAPTSSGGNTLTLTGSDTYTFSGQVGTASDTASGALNLVMAGSGTQNLSGALVVLNNITAQAGTLNITPTSLTVLGNVGVYTGATLKLNDSFTLGSGQQLSVTKGSGSVATLSNALVLAGGTLEFDATALSTTQAQMAVSGTVGYGTETSSLTVTLGNSSNLSTGTYILASGDWSGITADSISLSGVSYMTSSFSTSSSALTLTLTLTENSYIWDGTDASHSWSSSLFGSSASVPTATAVFNDSAANKDVSITASGLSVSGLVFDSTGAYTVSVGTGGSTLTAGTLQQLGSGTTTLEAGAVKVSNATTIADGELVVKDTTSLAGTISGDGTLVIDWGDGVSGSLDVNTIGTLHVKSGSYGTAKDGVQVTGSVLVDAGATYIQGDNITSSSAITLAGTATSAAVFSMGGNAVQSGAVNMSGSVTLNVRDSGSATISGAISGTGDLTVNDNGSGLILSNADAVMNFLTVNGGHVTLSQSATYAGINSFTVQNGGVLELGTATRLRTSYMLLTDGAELRMQNGNWAGGTVNIADLQIKDSATISGSVYGNTTDLSGAVRGNGTLTLSQSGWTNAWTVSADIADDTDSSLALQVQNGSEYEVYVTISGSNFYSGGTTVASGTLTTGSSSALGTGDVTMAGGTLTLGTDLALSGLKGDSGTVNIGSYILSLNGGNDTTYTGTFNANGGSIVKVGAGSQTISAVSGSLDTVGVEAGSLELGSADITGSIIVFEDALLKSSSAYTLSSGTSLAAYGSATLGALTLSGGELFLSGSSLSSDSALLTTGAVTYAEGTSALNVYLSGYTDMSVGTYMLASGNWTGVDASTITLSLVSRTAATTTGTIRTTSDGLYLVLSGAETVWAGTETQYNWSTTEFSQYDASAVASAGEAIFTAAAENQNVSVTEAVEVDTITISGGAYTFSGDGSVTAGTLALSGSGTSAVVNNDLTVSSAVTVDSGSLTLVSLDGTPTFALSNAAELTLGSADNRLSAFSGAVTGDAGSALHLYTDTVDSEYWGRDGRVILSETSTVQDVYIHGDLALNIIASKQSELGTELTDLRTADIHLDDGAQIVVRAETGGELTLTTGNIILSGTTSLVTYSPLTTATVLTSDFTQADDTSATLIKTDEGSITLSGSLALDALQVVGSNSKGTLRLTGDSVTIGSLTLSDSGKLETTAGITISGAVTTSEGTSWTLDESAVQTLTEAQVAGVNSLVVNSNATLKVGSVTTSQNNTSAALNGVSGTGTVELLLGNNNGVGFNLSNFSGSVRVAADTGASGNGRLQMNTSTFNEASTIVLTSTGDLVFNGDKSVANNIEVEGSSSIYTNGSCTGSLSGSLTGDSVTKRGGGTLKLTGDVDLTSYDAYVGTTEFSGTASIGTLNLNVGGNVRISGGTTTVSTAFGSGTGTLTLAGGQLTLGDAETASMTFNGTLRVSSSDATADNKVVSTIYNAAACSSPVRSFASVDIAENNVLSLTQNSWNTIWEINSLSGAGTLRWDFGQDDTKTSQLILSGDNDFRGDIVFNRTGAAQWWGTYQGYIVLTSEGAAKNATLSLLGLNSGHAGLALSSDAVVQGISGNEYGHILSGEAPGEYSGESIRPITSASPSTSEYCLTIAGDGDYTYAGTIGTASDTAHLSVMLNGEGSQTLSGVSYLQDVTVTDGSLSISNTSSVVSGDISVSGGSLSLGATYTLGTDNTLSVLSDTTGAVSLAGLTLSGGTLVFDSNLLSSDAAALTVGSAVTLTEGATTNVEFNNFFYSSTSLMLASGNWSGVDASGFTASSLNTTLYSASFSTDETGVYVSYTLNANTWVGEGDTGTWDLTTANWDQTPATLDDDPAVFNVNLATRFTGSTAVTLTLSEAVSSPVLVLESGASVTIDETTAALTADSIVVESGATLTFATARAGYTDADISGSGRVALALTDDSWSNKLNLGDNFTGETYVTSGYIDLTGAKVGSKLILAGGVNANGAEGSAELSADLVLEGTSIIHANGSKPLTYNGSVTGENGVYKSAGSSSHNFNGIVALAGIDTDGGADLNFNAAATLGYLTVESSDADATFAAAATITTLNISAASVTLNGATEIGALNASGGTTNLNGNTEIDTLTFSSGTVNFATAGASYDVTTGIATANGGINSSMTIASDVIVNAGELKNNWGFGTLDVDGTLALTGQFYQWSGNVTNSITGDGVISVGGNATFGNVGSYNVSVEQLNVAGNVTFSTSRTTEFSDGTTTVQGTLSQGTGTITISGGTLDVKSNAVFSSGSLNLTAGTLTLEGTENTVSNTFTMTGGTLNVNGGSLNISNPSEALSGNISVSNGSSLTVNGAYTLAEGNTLSVLTDQAVSFTGFTLAGGTLVFDAELLSGDSAALSITTDAVTQTEGAATTVIFNNYAYSSSMLKLASGDWSAVDDGSFSATSSGSWYSVSFETRGDGLYVTHSLDANTWVGGESGTWDLTTTTDWDQTSDVLGDDSAVYDQSLMARFAANTTAEVTLGAEMTITRIVVENGAAVTLNESSYTLNTSASIYVEEGATLTFATQKAGYTAANITGDGTVYLALNDTTNDWGQNLKLGAEFTGTTYLTDGRFTINGSSFGETLHLGSGVTGFQLTGGSTYTFTKNLILDGTAQVHQNSGATLTFTGTVTGDGTYDRRGGGTLTFDCEVSLGGFTTGSNATTLFNRNTILSTLELSQGTVTLNAATNVTSLTTSDAGNGAVTLGTGADGTLSVTNASFSAGALILTGAGTMNITTAEMSGGSVTVNAGTATVSTLNMSTGSGTLGAGTDGTLNVTNANVSGGTLTLTGSGTMNITTATLTGGSVTVSAGAATVSTLNMSTGSGTLGAGTDGTLNVTNANVSGGALTLTGGGIMNITTAALTGGSVTVSAGAALITNVNTATGSAVLATAEDGSLNAGYINVTGGELTLTGNVNVSGKVYPQSGTLNIGSDTATAFVITNRLEAGDNIAGKASSVNIGTGSVISITGADDIRAGVDGYHSTGLILSEWGAVTTLNVNGTLLAESASAAVGDSGANINIASGGVMAVEGIVNGSTNANNGTVTLTLADKATLILGANGINLGKTFSGTLGAGKVGMSTETVEIAENLTLNSAAGTTFDTTLYAFTENAASVAEGIEQGDSAGTMTLSGEVTSAADVDAVMNVVGTGELKLTGSADLTGGLTVESHAALNVNDMARLTSFDGTNNAELTGGVKLGTVTVTTETTAEDGSVSTTTTTKAGIAGTGETKATVSNSLIAIQQGATLELKNVVLSNTQVTADATAAVMALADETSASTGVYTVEMNNATVQLTSDNTSVAGSAITLTEGTALTEAGYGTSGTIATTTTALTLSSTALSGVNITGSHFTIDLSGVLETISGWESYNLFAVTFENSVFSTPEDTVIRGILSNDQTVAGWYVASTEAGTDMTTVYFSTESVPEPTTGTLSILALAALAARRRRR